MVVIIKGNFFRKQTAEVSSAQGCWSCFQSPVTYIFMPGLMQPQSQNAANVLVKLRVDLFLKIFRETLLFTTGSTALGVTLFSPCRSHMSSPFAATRWQCWCILQLSPGHSASYCGSIWEKTSSHHYHKICKLPWQFSYCKFWYAACCFNYSKMLFQILSSENTQNTLCLILWALVKLEMNGD